MQPVKRVYHATSKLFKTSIVKAQKLYPQTHNPSQDWMLLLDSEHKNKIPKGVWFRLTLFNDDLPNMSPYGGERIKIPIENVFSQLGGKFNLFQGKTALVNGNTYIRLMLVKEEDNFDCLEHMKELDLNDNDFFKCISGLQVQVPKRPTWVEIYVPYEIDISEGEWDQVKWLLSK